MFSGEITKKWGRKWDFEISLSRPMCNNRWSLSWKFFTVFFLLWTELSKTRRIYLTRKLLQNINQNILRRGRNEIKTNRAKAGWRKIFEIFSSLNFSLVKFFTGISRFTGERRAGKKSERDILKILKKNCKNSKHKREMPETT